MWKPVVWCKRKDRRIKIGRSNQFSAVHGGNAYGLHTNALLERIIPRKPSGVQGPTRPLCLSRSLYNVVGSPPDDHPISLFGYLWDAGSKPKSYRVFCLQFFPKPYLRSP